MTSELNFLLSVCCIQNNNVLIIVVVKKKYGCECEEVTHVVSLKGSGVSGGTIASIVNEMNSTGLKNDPYHLCVTCLSCALPGRGFSANRYLLNPSGKKPTLKQPLPVGMMSYDSFTKGWTIPFLMVHHLPPTAHFNL